VPQTDNKIAVHNGSPGIANLRIVVNGEKIELAGLRDREIRTIDVSATMVAGNNNSITLTALGEPGGTAAVLIH
jgi:hypothetical protein